jgi:hypothetical protein
MSAAIALRRSRQRGMKAYVVFDSLLFARREQFRGALALWGESVMAPERYYDVNVHGTRVLLDAMVRAGVRAMVFFIKLRDLWRAGIHADQREHAPQSDQSIRFHQARV